MILWILALVLLGSLGVIGFYQGAIRVGFSLVGLLLGAFLAIPLGYLIQPLLKLVGMSHPVWLAFVAPFIAYLLVLIGAKVAGLALHRKVDGHYKYKESDTKRMLWERLNARLGICLGVANATVYVFLIAFVAYLVGYFTKQVATDNQTSMALRLANLFADGLEGSGMARAVSPFMPSRPFYYDAVDVVGLIYHNPLLQSRLATYPAFLTLEDKGEFKALAKDQSFQQTWLTGISFGDFLRNDNVKSLANDVDFYTNVLALVNGDWGDLKTYLLTGKSPRFEEEKILGRWSFDYAASFAQAKRKKAVMSLAEVRAIRRALSLMNRSIFTAYMDNSAKLVIPGETNQPSTRLNGTWRNDGGGRYRLKLREAKIAIDGSARIDNDKIVFSRDNVTLVYER